MNEAERGSGEKPSHGEKPSQRETAGTPGDAPKANENIPTTPSADQLEHSLNGVDREGLDEEELQETRSKRKSS